MKKRKKRKTTGERLHDFLMDEVIVRPQAFALTLLSLLVAFFILLSFIGLLSHELFTWSSLAVRFGLHALLSLPQSISSPLIVPMVLPFIVLLILPFFVLMVRKNDDRGRLLALYSLIFWASLLLSGYIVQQSLLQMVPG
jgi:hypothetical protein